MPGASMKVDGAEKVRRRLDKLVREDRDATRRCATSASACSTPSATASTRTPPATRGNRSPTTPNGVRSATRTRYSSATATSAATWPAGLTRFLRERQALRPRRRPPVRRAQGRLRHDLAERIAERHPHAPVPRSADRAEIEELARDCLDEAERR